MNPASLYDDKIAMGLITFLENKHNAVADSWERIGNVVIVALRTIKYDFEYTVQVKYDLDTEFVLEYQFISAWYREGHKISIETLKPLEILVANPPKPTRKIIRTSIGEVGYLKTKTLITV